jgi:hypothetical protein
MVELFAVLRTAVAALHCQRGANENVQADRRPLTRSINDDDRGHADAPSAAAASDVCGNTSSDRNPAVQTDLLLAKLASTSARSA